MILAIIQARMSSTRLPGKVLMPIHGKPMLQWVVEAAQGATKVDKVVVATSTDPSDAPIVNAGFLWNTEIFQGELKNVLDRYYQAAAQLEPKPEHIVRLTSDCPLVLPKLIDHVIGYHKLWGNDYTWNRDMWPSGFDVEVFTMDALERAHAEATTDYDKEHVTTYMRSHTDTFNCGCYKGQLNERFDGKWSVDTLEELKFVTKYFNLFKKVGIMGGINDTKLRAKR